MDKLEDCYQSLLSNEDWNSEEIGILKPKWFGFKKRTILEKMWNSVFTDKLNFKGDKMSKFLLANKLIDTESCTMVIDELREGFDNRRVSLFRTKNGNWFTAKSVDGVDCIQAYTAEGFLSDEDVKQIFCKENAIDLYREYFGEIEKG